jgi:hypothetical protein
LPKSLDSISYLGFNKEVHISGQYFANFSVNTHEFTFTLQSTSLFRIYVAPHDVDVDLWLYRIKNGGREYVASSGLEVGTEEVIQKELSAGDYVLKLLFFGVLIGHYEVKDCDTVLMELQIVPSDVMQRYYLNNFIASYNCKVAYPIFNAQQAKSFQIFYLEG